MRRFKQVNRIFETLHVILGERNQTVEKINRSLPEEYSCNVRTTRRDLKLLLAQNMIGQVGPNYFAKVRVSFVDPA